MKYYPHPILAREGWLYIGLSCITALLILTIHFWLAVPFILIAIFIIQFFTDADVIIRYLWRVDNDFKIIEFEPIQTLSSIFILELINSFLKILQIQKYLFLHLVMRCVIQ